MRKFIAAALLICLPFLAQAQTNATNSSESIGARKFVDQFWSEWSSPNLVAIPYLQSTIDDQINFYGKSISRDAYMKVQLAFTKRWPQRQYAVQPGSETVKCEPGASICKVMGIVAWSDFSPTTGFVSTGLEKFSFSLRYEIIDGDTLYLLNGESGSVISRNMTRATSVHGCAAFGAAILHCRSYPEWTSGVWTPPVGVSSVRVLLVGGGGGGAYTQIHGMGGPGGGSGKVVVEKVSLNGQPVEVQVGQGGVGSGQFEQGGRLVAFRISVR